MIGASAHVHTTRLDTQRSVPFVQHQRMCESLPSGGFSLLVASPRSGVNSHDGSLVVGGSSGDMCRLLGGADAVSRLVSGAVMVFANQCLKRELAGVCHRVSASVSL